jgi:DDE superfamily endonuclease
LSKQFFKPKIGIADCIGAVDGTSVILSESSQLTPEVYWSHKQNYAIALQLVCNEKKEIIYFQTGWPGSVCDSTCYNNSYLTKNKEQLFKSEEYLLGDSGYSLVKRILTPYWGSKASKDTNMFFNYKLSSCRIIIEHTIGILKSRWSSLKGLRLQLKNTSDLQQINEWIVVCIILHNFLLKCNDQWDNTTPGEEEIQADDTTTPGDSNQNNYRKNRKKEVLDFFS